MNIAAVSHAPKRLAKEELPVSQAPAAGVTASDVTRLAAYATKKAGRLVNGFALAGVMVQSVVGAFPASDIPPFAEGSPRRR